MKTTHSHTSQGTRSNNNTKSESRKDNVNNYVTSLNKEHTKTNKKNVIIDNNWSANENPFLNEGALRKVLKEEFPTLVSDKPANLPGR